MARFMDYMISPYPIRIIDLKVDKSKLNVRTLRILNVGHLPGRTLYRNNASFDHWAIVYIAGGKGSFQVNNRERQPVQSGSLFLLHPGATYHYGPDKNGYWDEYYFTIEGDRVAEWLGSWLTEPDQVRHVGSDDTQHNKMDRIFMLMESGVPVNVDRAALLLESMLYEFVLRANGTPESTKNEQIINLMEDISDSLYQPFDSLRIVKRHHISLSTLRRLVSEYTGYPLNEYIHRLKMAEAKNILLNTDRSIKEIADLLGYKEPFYFSRLFKKYVGISPLLYRNTM
jgi:AraC family transcriptional regulator of arabinose operon